MSELYRLTGAGILPEIADPDPPPLQEQAVPPQLPRPRRRSRPEGYRIFHYAVLGYLYLLCSRVLELLPGLHLTALLMMLLFVGLFIAPGGTNIFRSASGRVLAVFTAWIGFCVPFAVWQGGSFGVFRGSLQAFVLVAAMAAFIRSVRDVLNAMYAVALAMGTVAVLSFASSRVGERLGIEGSSTLGDPNTLALFVLLGMPLLYLLASRTTGLKRLVALGLLLVSLAAFSKTASRMGLLLLLTMGLLTFVFANSKQRIGLMVGGMVLLLIAVMALPERTKNRFLEIFSGSGDAATQDEAQASSAIREYALRRSLEITAQNPIVGVGPGNFITAEANLSKQENRRGAWVYSHNAYTQISSETGIPGLLLFLLCLFYAFKGLNRIRKRSRVPAIRTMAAALFISFVLISEGALFLSVAYGGAFYVFIGLAITFKAAVGKEAKLAAAAQS